MSQYPLLDPSSRLGVVNEELRKTEPDVAAFCSMYCHHPEPFIAMGVRYILFGFADQRGITKEEMVRMRVERLAEALRVTEH